MKRREFLTDIGLGAAALSLGGRVDLASAANDNQVYPFSSAVAAFTAAGFDPASADAAYFAVAADCHYGQCKPRGLLPIIEEVNSLRPRPAFFVLNGDMAVSASKYPGQRPSEKQKQVTYREFEAFREHISQLDSEIPLKITLGNHDTSPAEDEPELFHHVFPKHPAYQSFDHAGAHFVLLNGHSDGRIDDAQAAWFADDIAAIDRSQEVITFVHQPGLGSVTYERMIAPAYQRALAKHQGDVWAICGHWHSNVDHVFKLPHTTIAQATIVCSADGVWGSAEKPGYWLYLMQGGKIVDRVFRKVRHGFRIENLPDRATAKPIPKPFEFVRDILWQTRIGEGDRPYLVEQDAYDNVSCWCYARKLVYALPLREFDARRFAVLGDVKAGVDGTGDWSIRVSGDRKDWKILDLPASQHHVMIFPISESLRTAEKLYVEISRPDDQKTEIFIAGYALMG